MFDQFAFINITVTTTAVVSNFSSLYFLVLVVSVARQCTVSCLVGVYCGCNGLMTSHLTRQPFQNIIAKPTFLRWHC